MKKIFIIMCLAFFIFTAPIGAQINKTLEVSWEQDSESLLSMANGGGWKLYVSDIQGGPYIQALDTTGQPIYILYDGSGASTYISNQTITIPGTPDQTVTKYFTLTAVATNGVESTYSLDALNEDGTVGQVFVIPVGVPFNLIIKIQ